MDKSNRYWIAGLLALCLFTVPLLSWCIIKFSEFRYDTQFRNLVVNEQKYVTATEFENKGLNYIRFCKDARAGEAIQGIEEFCSYADEIKFTQLASLLTAGVGIVLFLLIFGGRRIAGTNRRRMSFVFSPLVRITMLLLSISILAQGALLIYAIYTIEVTAIQRVHIGILFVIAIGVLTACWILLKSSIALLKHEPMLLRPIALDKYLHEYFFSFVNRISSKLGTQMPDHIVVGLEPNFFVTAADVQLAGQEITLKGRTLYISLSLLHLFNEDELTAVIGHELGHFRGEDVAYSIKFAPIYMKLSQTLEHLGESTESAADLGKLPAQIALWICLIEFASAERTVGRERELLADQAGAEAANGLALAHALVKISLFAPQWNSLTRTHIDELSEGRMFINLAQTYAYQCLSITTDTNWKTIYDELGKSVQSHPIDTHPTLLTRLQNLKITLLDIAPEKLGTPDTPANNLILEVAELEEALSTLEVQWLVATRMAVLPKTLES